MRNTQSMKNAGSQRSRRISMDRRWCGDPVNFSYLVWPVGSLLGGRPWVSSTKWGFALSFPFSGASVFAAFKAPF